MRKTMMAAAVLGFSGAVMADNVVEQILVADLVTLGANEVASYLIDLPNNDNQVIGIGFRGDVTGISGNAMWASDMRLDILHNGMELVSVGGFTDPAPAMWAFDGAASTNDGFYAQEFILADMGSKGGEWRIDFRNDWAFAPAPGQTWDFEIYLIKKVPAPGALALLGLAGLAGRRRRA